MGRAVRLLLRAAAAGVLIAGVGASLALRRLGVAQFGDPLEGWLVEVGPEGVWAGGIAALCLFGLSLRGRAQVGALALAVLAGAAGVVPALAGWRQPARVPWSGEAAAGGAAAERRVLWIGVDAFTWTRALPLVQRGRLPHLARLLAEGSYDVLVSDATYRRSVDRVGYWSPVVWTTVATGVGVGRHGIDDFTIRRPPSGRSDGTGPRGRRAHPTASFDRRTPAFWNLYSHYGRAVGVVGWWASWPAEPVLGVMASSGLGLRGLERGENFRRETPAWRAGRSHLTYPAEFLRVIVDEVRPPADAAALLSEIGMPAARSIRDFDRQAALESVLWQDQLYLAIALRLLGRERFPLTAVYFEGIDAASHGFWLASEPGDALAAGQSESDPERAAGVVDAMYGVVDRWLGELRAAAGKDVTVVLSSDHGFRSFDEDGRRSANHDGLGALLLAGSGIRAGQSGLQPLGLLAGFVHGRPRLVDVLPTLLYLQGLPIADDLEGRVLGRWLEPRLRSHQPQYHVPDYAAVGSAATSMPDLPGEAEAEYRRRLHALGYLD